MKVNKKEITSMITGMATIFVTVTITLYAWEKGIKDKLIKPKPVVIAEE